KVRHIFAGRVTAESSCPTRLRGGHRLPPSAALRHPCCPIYPPPHLPKGAKGAENSAQPWCWSAGEVADATGFGESRTFAHQYQRDGVILDQRFGIRTTRVLSVGKEQRALVASLKSLQQPRPGMVG